METQDRSTPVERDQRLGQASAWLQLLDINIQSDFHPVAGDASFRRYFRLKADGVSRILMDAPPPDEDIGPFLDIAGRLRRAGLYTPEIIHADRESGFILLEDLGDDIYRDLLNRDTVDEYFPGLLGVLKDMALKADTAGLPEYDAALLQAELDLFPDWYLGRHRCRFHDEQFETVWEVFCDRIVTSAREQPQCFVHRDFHSCNLMRAGANNVGIIDFQDAVKGPVSYDFISLVWDRYLNWPRARIEIWMEDVRQSLGLEIDSEKWQRYCDLMGLQRNFKIVGIFARLYYRDGKRGYIEMIPQFYDYLTSTLHRYPEFGAMLDILEKAECAP